MAIRRKVSVRKRPTQERARATVDAIIAAAEKVLASHGLAGMTTARVAEVAGVSVGTLYQYFPSREAILAVVIRANTEAGHRLIAQTFEAALALPLADAIRLVCRALVTNYGAGRAAIQGPLTDADTEAGHAPQHRAHLDQIRMLLRGLLVAQRAQLRVDDVDTAAFLLVTAAEGVARGLAHAPEPMVGNEALIALMSDALVRFLVAET